MCNYFPFCVLLFPEIFSYFLFIYVVVSMNIYFKVQLLIQNTEWELISLTKERNAKKYNCCPEPYIDVTFNMTVKRRSPTYKAIIITPAFGMSPFNHSLQKNGLVPNTSKKLFISSNNRTNSFKLLAAASSRRKNPVKRMHSNNNIHIFAVFQSKMSRHGGPHTINR